MKKRRLLQLAAACLLGGWIVVTVAATGAMYKLWWDRERPNYLHVSPQKQLVSIWNNAGLPLHLLEVFEDINASWPGHITYSLTGDANQTSYLKYLLIPRIPSGDGTYSVDSSGTFVPREGMNSPKPLQTFRPTISGFLWSLFVITGASLALMKIFQRLRLSFPETFTCCCLLLMGCIVISRAVFATISPGCLVYTILGGVSWIWIACMSLKNIPKLSNSLPERDYSNKFWGLKIFAGGFISLILIWVLLMSVIVVVDDWDAWAIWGAKAKVLALGVGPLRDVIYFGHGDYPLLWPSIWAFTAWFNGGWEDMWSRAWGAIFLFLTVWEIVVIVSRSTKKAILATLSGGLFLSMPMIPLVASWSYAEAPYWLATSSCFGVLLLLREKNGTPQLRLIFIAAILAAASAYIKNEGVLFGLLAGCWLLIGLRGPSLKQAGIFLFTFLVCYSPWLIWTKGVLQLTSHATAGLHLSGDTIWRAIDRTPAALGVIAKMWLDIRQWNIVLWGLLCVTAFTVREKDWLINFMLPVATLIGYLLIIVFHEAEVYWQVGTSWNRLTIHTLPLLVIGCVLQLNSISNSRRFESCSI